MCIGRKFPVCDIISKKTLTYLSPLLSQESMLNGRIEPAGVVDGFTAEIGASGSFCPKHTTLPVTAYFFHSLSEDNAPSPYLVSLQLIIIAIRASGHQLDTHTLKNHPSGYPKRFVIDFSKCQFQAYN